MQNFKKIQHPSFKGKKIQNPSDWGEQNSRPGHIFPDPVIPINNERSLK